MRSLPINDEYKSIARKVIWFEPPESALADPVRFVAYAMTYGSHDTMKALREYYSDDEMREVLRSVAPGIIDARSWSYWHLVFDCYPPPPIPQRILR
ncbi:hypothetical protein ACVBEJ_09380 [Porticoccus sp. GXU_MW_L64]